MRAAVVVGCGPQRRAGSRPSPPDEMDAPMFCPYCGKPLVTLPDGEARCEASGALFSRHLVETLTDRFGPRSSVHPAKPLPFAIGGTWHCPHCATGMRESAGVVECPACRRHLQPLVYEIVELNPHAGA